jgi:hypothetical protein
MEYIYSDDDEDSYRSSRSSSPRSRRPLTAETDYSYDRPPTPYSRASSYDDDRPFTGQTDDSFRPLTGETDDSHRSPRNSARGKKSDDSKKPDSGRSHIDAIIKAQEQKYLQKSVKSEDENGKKSLDDYVKEDDNIVDNNSFVSQGMNRSLSSQEMSRSMRSQEMMNKSLTLSLTSIGTGDTRTRAQKKRADLYGIAPQLSTEKNSKYRPDSRDRPDSGYSTRSDHSRSDLSQSEYSARSDYSSVSSRTRYSSDTGSSYSRGGTPYSNRSESSYDSRTPRSRLPSGDDEEFERLPTDRSGFSDDRSYYSRDGSRPYTGQSLSARISGTAPDDQDSRGKRNNGSIYSNTGGSLSTTHLEGASTSISSRISHGVDRNEFDRKRKEQRMELLSTTSTDQSSNGGSIRFPQIKK